MSGGKSAIATKQVIIIRKDLNMRRGKEIAQGSHASLAFLTRRLERKNVFFSGQIELFIDPPHFYECILKSYETEWLLSSFRKVTLQVNSEAELLALDEAAKNAKLESHLVRDQGLTEFDGVPTYTALAIGPDYDDKIDQITGHLRLY